MIVAGIGFTTRATARSLGAALDCALRAAGLAHVDALATAPVKASAPLLVDFARARALPVLAVDVAGVITPTTSPRVQAQFATGSLAEAAALVAAGPHSDLAQTRILSPCGQATCAIALSKDQP